MNKLGLSLFFLLAPAIGGVAESAFLESVTSIGRAHDLERWQALYCEHHVADSNEKRVVEFFTSAQISGAIHSASKEIDAKLSVCFEPPTAKEMCMQVVVARKANSLCLVAPLPPNKALKKDARENTRAS